MDQLLRGRRHRATSVQHHPDTQESVVRHPVDLPPVFRSNNRRQEVAHENHQGKTLTFTSKLILYWNRRNRLTFRAVIRSIGVDPVWSPLTLHLHNWPASRVVCTSTSREPSEMIRKKKTRKLSSFWGHPVIYLFLPS